MHGIRTVVIIVLATLAALVPVGRLVVMELTADRAGTFQLESQVTHDVLLTLVVQ